MPDRMHLMHSPVKTDNALGAFVSVDARAHSFRMLLAQIRKARGLSQSDLADMVGVNQSTIQRAETMHASAKMETYERCAAALSVPLAALFGADPIAVEDGLPAPNGSALVPIHDVHASAGDGAVVDGEDQIGSLAFPRDYLTRLTRSHPRHLKIISVKGDSMLPTVADDDLVMLDLSKRDLSYDGLFVIRDNGDALQVKRVGRASQPGAVTIISDNRQLYPPVERSLQHIEVIGRVIWHGRKV